MLEETARRLMDDLKAVTDDCVIRIESAYEQAEKRLSVRYQQLYGDAQPSADHPELSHCTQPRTVPRHAGASAYRNSAPSVDTPASLTNGEAELVRGLQLLGKSRKAD